MLFAINPCKHPIVILKDVQFKDLKTLIDFIYFGEVNVSQEHLPSLLKVSIELSKDIKGASEYSTTYSNLLHAAILNPREKVIIQVSWKFYEIEINLFSHSKSYLAQLSLWSSVIHNHK